MLQPLSHSRWPIETRAVTASFTSPASGKSSPWHSSVEGYHTPRHVRCRIGRLSYPCPVNLTSLNRQGNLGFLARYFVPRPSDGRLDEDILDEQSHDGCDESFCIAIAPDPIP